MLKYLFMTIFLIPLCLLNNCWWLVHSLMIRLSFVFMICVYSYAGLNMISYYFGIDYFSFSLILLSFWICSLTINASGSVYLSSYHSNFFVFMVLILMIMLYCSFASMSLLSFYIFLSLDWFLLYFWFWVEVISLNVFKLVFI